MEFHVAWWGAVLAAIAGMVPGAIIYAPNVLGKVWAKETGRNVTKMSGKTGGIAMLKMLIATFVTACFMSMVFWYVRPTTAGYGVLAALVLSWFPISFIAGAVFFEGRSRTWAKISVLTQVLTFAAIGLVLSFFLP